MKHTLLALALVALATGAMAQEKAKIYFIRSTGYNWGGAYKAFIDEKLVCNIQNKRYSIHEVEPGEHRVSVQFSGKQHKGNDEPIVITVEAGKKYYVEMAIKRKFATSDLYCQEVTESTAKNLMKECKEDETCF
jgi:hypothetical protein